MGIKKQDKERDVRRPVHLDAVTHRRLRLYAADKDVRLAEAATEAVKFFLNNRKKTVVVESASAN